MFRQTLERLSALGCDSVMLWTLQGNPVRAWYQRLGGELIGEKTCTIEDWPIVEVACGWRSLPALVKKLSG